MIRPWAKVLIAAFLPPLLFLLAPSNGVASITNEYQGWVPDTGTPFKELLQRAESGDVVAALAIAAGYHTGTGGAPHDDKEAVKWFKVVADRTQDGRAEWMVAMAYETGRGVEKNGAESTKWTKRSAEKGTAAAQLRYGQTCAIGANGVPQSQVEAQKWIEKAAQTGDPVLQLEAGYFHFAHAVHEGPGTPHATNAVVWLRKAADQGQSEAQSFLGACYWRGIGVTKDLAEAYKWQTLAIRGQPGTTVSSRILSEISTTELKEGLRRAHEFVAHPSGIETLFVPREINLH